MKLGVAFREQLAAVAQVIVEELDRAYAVIRAAFSREHRVDGTHGAITATSLDVAGAVRVDQVRTGSGSTGAIATGVAFTLFAASGGGLWRVFAYLPNAGAANYTAFADVVSDLGTARIVANNGGLLTLTLSGNNVQVTQSSGISTNVEWSYLRVW